MEKMSQRVTVCLVLFVLIVKFSSSTKTVGLDESAFLRQIKRPPCAMGRCTGGKRDFSTEMERVLTKVSA